MTPSALHVIAEELRAISLFIKTPGNISRDDAVDEIARLLDNRARDLERASAQAIEEPR